MAQGNTCCAGLMFLLSIALPVAMIAVGAIYFDDCPREKFIPIYLVVAGAVAILKSIIMIGCYVASGDDPNKKGIGLVGVINLFIFAWFIAGAYWIYHIHKDYQSHTKGISSYCHNTLYQFAFWVQIVFFIILALEVIGACIKFCRK